MGRSTVHYADNETNNILKRLHNKLRPAGTPVERVEYIIELLLLRIFEVRLKQDKSFSPLRKLFDGENYRLLFSYLLSLTGDQVLSELNKSFFPFYASILTKSRPVFTGNLPTKIQDQLVLMEEVFANSNFTNNVKGGVIAEVIGLVNDIDEQKILKTDLLGDAIESALSETGGTKELGLFRTPDHVRKMMVEMVEPDFTDSIFDPACGTAGFLFDAYEHVIEKARQTRQFPPENIANQFYRVGLSGIEYQGRIRKMAAVNMYIRGLNPHNIEQGDSLKMYDPLQDANSKDVVIAYPLIALEELITPKYEKIGKTEYKGDFDIVDKIAFKDGNIHLREARQTGMDLYKANKGDLITSKINVHQGAVAISIRDLVCSTHYQVYEIDSKEVIPEYLLLVLRSKRFLDIVSLEKAGGIKNEAGAAFLSKFRVPLPPLESQDEIINKIKKQKQIIEGAEKIETSYALPLNLKGTERLSPIGDAVISTKNGWSPNCNGGDYTILSLSCLQNGRIDFTKLKYTNEYIRDMDKYYVKEGDFFIAEEILKN